VRVFASVGQKKYQIEETRPGGYSTELIGRNDIISRYIFMKTTQFRTRKQVSSHIQVWAHCRRPPSSRDMPGGEFERLQAMFQQYYSRQSSDQQQSKKKGRRVASASSASAAAAAQRVLSRGGLGICAGARSPVSAAGSLPAERKRSSQWFDDSPAKRCRRVVSEMPPLDFGLSREHGEGAAELSLMGPQFVHPQWKSGPVGALFDVRAVSGVVPGTHLQPLVQGTPLLAHPAMFLPPLDLAVDARHSVYGLGISSPMDPSVAAFAATLAAMTGLEADGASPALGAGNCAAALVSAAPSPQAFKGMAAASCDNALGFAAGAISAFATAASAVDCPGSMSPHLRHALPVAPVCSTPASAVNPRVRCGDVYAPLHPSSWGQPSTGSGAAYGFQHTGPDMPTDTSAPDSTAAGLDAPAAVSVPDKPGYSVVSSTLLARADRSAGDPASEHSQASLSEDPPSSPALAAMAVDFVAHWMERLRGYSGADSQSCDPGLLTAHASSASPPPSGCSGSSADGGGGSGGDCNYDWNVNFLPFITYPL
ncbi:hypothetical protein IWQ56_003706, partial [Coemansia nantahalensis]